MSGKTSIEWTRGDDGSLGATWNPTTGCDRVSPGCDRCYAMSLAPRLKAMGSKAYQLDGDPRMSGPGFLAHEWPNALDWPLHKRKPLRIFVNSMSDLFHDNVSDEYIAQVWAVMARCPQHTFQILTKRHARMRSLLSSASFWAKFWRTGVHGLTRLDVSDLPLRNVWLGVSVETQQWADIRIPALLDTPAVVRFLSCEPLLGPLDVTPYLATNRGLESRGKRIEWIITGGESGHGARPANPDWFRAIRDQCTSAGVAYLHKQNGEFLKEPGFADDYVRVGKKAAGRELDGRTWDQYPAVAS